MSPFIIIPLSAPDWFVHVLRWLRHQIEDYPLHKAIGESVKWLWRKITARIERWFDFWVYTLVIGPIERLFRISLAAFVVIGALVFFAFNQRRRATV